MFILFVDFLPVIVLVVLYWCLASLLFMTTFVAFVEVGRRIGQSRRRTRKVWGGHSEWQTDETPVVEILFPES